MVELAELVALDGTEDDIISGLQTKYTSLARNEGIWPVLMLENKTKIVPKFLDDDLRDIYLKSAGDYSLMDNISNIKDWDRHVHGGQTTVFDSLDPGEFSSAAQEGYVQRIVHDWRVTGFNETADVTGVGVTQESVNEGFNQRIKNRNVTGDWEINRIEENTGKRPVVDQNLVQEMYVNMSNDKDIYFWEYLFNSTGIKPDENIAQEGYKIMSAYDIGKYSKMFGIKPDESLVHLTYFKQLEWMNSPRGIIDLQEATGIKPSEEIVHACYDRLVNGVGVSIPEYYLISMNESTGVMPRESLVQKAYANTVSKGQFDKYEELRNHFKVEPNSEVKQSLDQYLTS